MNRSQTDSGFTLIEYLVASSLGLLCCGLAFGILNQLFIAAQRSRAIADIHQEVSIAFEIIENDLRRAGNHGLRPWLLIHNAEESSLGDKLFFLTQSPLWMEAGESGDLIVVGYFLQWRNATATRPGGYDLCRSIREPSDVITDLPAESLNQNHRLDEVEIIAQNIAYFSITAQQRNRRGASSSQEAISPDYIEIELLSLSPEQVTKLQSPSDWKISRTHSLTLLPFRIRIEIPKAMLDHGAAENEE